MAKPRNLAAALDVPLTGLRWARLVNYDIAIAVFVVAVVALFVLPLPTVVLDGLISLNLAASIVLLCVSIYLPSALAFSSFPAVLLFTTLFRLSLNIASCKLILLQANAGHVIDTFGKLRYGLPGHYGESWRDLFIQDKWFSADIGRNLAVNAIWFAVAYGAAHWWFGRKDIHT